MRDTKDILKAWKNTRVLKRIGIEYPTRSAGIEGAQRNFDYRQYLTEEEAQIVDESLLALKEDNYHLWVILTAIYQRNYNCNRLAHVMGLSKNDTYKKLDKAESFIRGHIYTTFNKKTA